MRRVAAASCCKNRVFAFVVTAALAAAPVPAFANESHDFEIAATDISIAVREFGKQAGVEILASADLLRGKTLHPLNGEYSTDQALNILLAQTGLTHRYVGERGVVLVAADSANNAEQEPARNTTDAYRADRFRIARADSSSSALLESDVAAAGQTGSGSLSSSSQDAAVKLEEIIVTAQKRVQSLQDVPISVQVVGGQKLQQENFNTLEQLAQVVPDVHVVTGDLSTNLFMRGIGSGQNQALDQSVSIFVDDIYHGRSRTSGATFLDLDRIEVLKGPQSTFFGNNAIAGALNIVSKKPGEHFESWVRALYGSYGQYALEGAIGGPLSDALRARFAVTRNGGEGWIDNLNTGKTAPNTNNLAGRLTLMFQPNDALEATLKLEGSLQKTAGSPGDQPSQWINCPPPAPFTPAFTAIPGGGCTVALALGVPIGLDQDATTSSHDEGSRLETFESVLTLDYHIGQHLLTSVSGYNEYDFNQRVAIGQLPV